MAKRRDENTPAPLAMPPAPWIWDDRNGYVLCKAGHGADQRALGPLIAAEGGKVMLAGPVYGKMMPAFPDHPVAALVQESPQLLTAAELFVYAYDTGGGNRELMRMAVERANEAIRRVRRFKPMEDDQ